MNKYILPVLFLLLPFLTACTGFSPVYAEKNGARSSFSSIQMSEIEGRTGFFLNQEMLERGGIQTGNSGKYQLDIKLSPARLGFGVLSDNVATRYQIQLTANWVLRDRQGKPLTNMTASSTASFASPASPYASQVAEKDAEERALSALADTILDQLGFYFAANRDQQ